MRFRFQLSHPDSGSSLEISEPDGWSQAVLKLDRHETFHSLVEYFDGSFILYGNNGVVNGGIDFVKNIIRNYGIDTTIEIVIDITFDEETFENVFTGQLGIADKEEIENNKMRMPIIRDDQWAKFISRLDTPVNIQSELNLADEATSTGENVNLKLTSQVIQYRTHASLTGSFIYGFWVTAAGQYMQIDWDTYTLDELTEKFSYPISFNPSFPTEKYSVDFDGEYYIRCRLYFTHVGMTIGGGGTVTFDGYFDLTRTDPDFQVELVVNGVTRAVFTQTDLGVDGTSGYSRYDLETTITLRANDKLAIIGRVLTNVTFLPMLLGSDTVGTGALGGTYQEPPGGSDPPDFPSGLTDDNELVIEALTTFAESNAESFLLHDAVGYIFDRITETEGSVYSELLGSSLTRYRQYPQDGCAWSYALVKGLQLRGYTLDEKSFFMSFNQWWRGADPILNLSLGYETVLIPHVVDVSPDINLIEDLADWENAGGPHPGGTWDFATFGHPFVSVNGGGGIEGYAAGEASFVEDQYYAFDTQIEVKSTGAETPNVVITWAILDASFNELDTKSFNYVGAGIKSEYFILQSDEPGFYFAVRIENNTPTETKNFEVLQAFTEDAQVEFTEEQVVRIEHKGEQYKGSEGTSVDFSYVKNITSKYDNDRIWNKVSIGYTKWESEDVSGIDDPQSKRTFATRFKKVGKGIDLYSEFIAASLAIEKTRRTTREKSSDYKYDNETFIIALNPLEQDESPELSPDVLNFIPELDENFSSVNGLLASETRYNLRITPTRNFLRWQDYLQGPLQSYLGSDFKFTSGDGNYSMSSIMDDNSCLGDGYGGNELDENGSIPVDTDFIHLPDLYEIEHQMEWDEYVQIRNNRKKPIGISLTDTDHKPMFIKTLSYKPGEGKFTAILWAKEYLDLSVISDTTPMRECIGGSATDECENPITDEFGNPLTDEFGECITADGESEGVILDAVLDAIL